MGVMHHPPVPIYSTADLLGYVEAAVLRIQLNNVDSQIILAGGLNQLSNSEVIVCTEMSSIVVLPTRGNNKLIVRRTLSPIIKCAYYTHFYLRM